jgi:uncharacterized protein
VVRVKVLGVDAAGERISLTLRLDDEPGGRAPRASPDAGQAAPQASRCTGHRVAPWPTRCAAPGWPATARQSLKRNALMNGLSQPTCENVDLAVN